MKHPSPGCPITLDSAVCIVEILVLAALRRLPEHDSMAAVGMFLFGASLHTEVHPTRG